jgi:LCP family protein required for cell wall assembly
MKPQKKLLLRVFTGISVIVFSGALIGGIKLIKRWNQPLASGLGLPTPTSSPTPFILSKNEDGTASASLETTSPEDTNSASFTPSPKIPPTPTSQPLCNGPDTMTILVLGIDYRGDSYLYGLADAIRVVRIDFTIPKVTALAIQRDVWVEIPDIADHYNITQGKINQAYLFGTEGMGYYQGPGGGPGLMARTLALNFGLYIDHYVTINRATFVRLVDAIGGIDIYIPYNIYTHTAKTPDVKNVVFNAGYHHLNGEQALILASSRNPLNKLDRIDLQTLLIQAIREKILSPTILTRIPKIIASFQDSIITDLSPAQISQFICLAKKVDLQNISFIKIPQEFLVPDRIYDPHRKVYTFVYHANFDSIRELMTQFQTGTWPDK